MERLKPILNIVLGLTVVAIIAAVVLNYSIVEITVPQGQTATIERTDTAIALAQLGAGTHRVILSTGNQLVIFQKGSEVTSMTTLGFHIGLAKVTAQTAVATKGNEAVNGTQPATLAATISTGTVYLSKTNRDVLFTTTAGQTTSLSSALNLATSAVDSDDPVFDTAFNISAINDSSVIVSTTLGAFIVKNPGDVQQLPVPGDLNFTASAYNASTHHLYIIANESNVVYGYDVTKPTDQPDAVFTGPSTIDRIATGGQKVVVYFDNVPSIEDGVVNAFSKTHQIKPLVYDLTKHSQKTLSGNLVTSNLSVSPDGRFIATKQKFATITTIHDLQSGGSRVIPASDTNVTAWSHDTLYFAYRSNVWSYDAAKKDGSVAPSILGGNNLIALDFSGTTPTLITSNGTIAQPTIALTTVNDSTSPQVPINISDYKYFSPNNL